MALREIYTIHQAAEYFDVHPTTIKRWIINGTLHATKVGGSYRIHKDDLHTLVEPERGTHQTLIERGREIQVALDAYHRARGQA